MLRCGLYLSRTRLSGLQSQLITRSGKKEGGGAKEAAPKAAGGAKAAGKPKKKKAGDDKGKKTKKKFDLNACFPNLALDKLTVNDVPDWFYQEVIEFNNRYRADYEEDPTLKKNGFAVIRNLRRREKIKEKNEDKKKEEPEEGEGDATAATT
eukprot:TRINITY_DN16171_c0_g1_i1.p1 TRINITY_DN16171_c0_g1~~TRINITY_DN16171_c0_g1_i1.p1  ORF type:complete len:152 (+),score=46.64 TRINITY_DN16171_c0_g1_i1:36-491(+)